MLYLYSLIEGIEELNYTISDFSSGKYYYMIVAHNEFGNTSSNCIEITVPYAVNGGTGGGGGGGTETTTQDDIVNVIIGAIIIGTVAIALGSYFIKSRSSTHIPKPVKQKPQKNEKMRERLRKKREQVIIGELTHCPFCQKKINIREKTCSYCGTSFKEKTE